MDKRKKNVNYSFLDENGLVKTRINNHAVYVEKGDVIIGKVLTKSNKNGDEELIDCSYVIKSGEEGYIDRVLETTTASGYKMIKVTIRNQRVPETGDKFACFDPDTEILTTDGWKNVKDIELTDEVACLIDGKRLEYHKPSKTQSYDFDGKLYSVESDKVSLLVTPNHRMYTGNCHRKNYDIRRADQIYGLMRSYQNNIDEWMPEKCLKTFTLPGYEELPELELDLEAWCLFFGIWIAEGSCTISYHDEDRTISNRQVAIAANKERVQKQLNICMKKLGLKCNLHMSKGELVKWYCGDKRLIYYLHPLSLGAINKFLPQWCFYLDMHHSQKLIEGMVLGDGDYMKNTTTTRYYTSSIQLRDDLQHVCLHAGWAANYYLKSEAGTKSMCLGKEITTNADHWTITICKTQNKPLVNKYINSKNIQLDSWVEYSGKVYCCTVPTKDGIIYVRRNGKSIWTGQSRSAQKGTCCVGDTLVTLSNGTSTKIKDININDEVWGWSGTGLQTSKCINKMYMGEKETITITMGHGKQLICTPEHRILTKNGWKEASQLTSEDYIIGNIPAPLDIKSNDEIDWSLSLSYENRTQISEFRLDMSNNIERQKSLAFARILGYILSDGWICFQNKKKEHKGYRSGVALGTLIDAKLFMNDLKMLLDDLTVDGELIKCTDNLRFYESNSFAGSCYVYDMPIYFANLLSSIPGISLGKRIQSKPTLPYFLSSAPLSFIREFVGGLFGGDGCAPYFAQRKDKKDLCSSNIMWKCLEKNVLDMTVCMTQIKNMLDKLNVESYINKPKYKKSESIDNEKRMVCGINILRKSDFLNNIGFRYCMYKQCKLTAASTFWQMKSYLSNKREGYTGLHLFKNLNIPSAVEWLTKINAIKWFDKGSHCVERIDIDVPYLYLPVVKVKPSGIKPVYDISVNKLESFIANGIVIHNCVYENTLITLSNGTSVKIKDINPGDNVWGWTGKGIQPAKCTNKQYMGEKETLVITLTSGRELTCTPDHRILTKDGWKEASELSLSDMIVANLPAPIDRKNKYEKNWVLKLSYNDNNNIVQNLNLTMDEDSEREKTLAFARILGYISMYGKILFNNDTYDVTTVFRSDIDLNIFINDLKLIDKTVDYNEIKYDYKLPASIANFIASVPGIIIDRYKYSKPNFPNFLEYAPISVLKEYVGGLFGGIGYAPHLSQGKLKRTKFTLINTESNTNDVNDYFDKLRVMLQNLGVNSAIMKPKVIKNSSDNEKTVQHSMKIFNFFNVGFRYNVYKQSRLSIATSFWQMKSYSKSFIDIEDWLKIIDASKFFAKDSSQFKTSDLQCYYMPISKIESAGIKHVYDITVEGLESFIGNGLLLHNCGMIYPEEDMPYTKFGVKPDIIINSHCVSEDTRVTLPNGLSKKIIDFSEQGLERVLTWSSKSESIDASYSLGMEHKGKQETLKITMIDGRELICTPDHKIKVSCDGEFVWKEAVDLTYDDQLLMGIEGTFDNKCDKEKDWELSFGEYLLNMKTENNREKSLAFARILGYLYTDGCLSENANAGYLVNKGVLYMGCMFDAKSMLDDVFTITDKRPKIVENINEKYGHTFNIHLPAILAKSIHKLENITIGRRSVQELTYPTFLFEENCPLSFIREFLASYFGGDGWSPYIDGNVFSHMQFSQSTILEFSENMKSQLTKIIQLLKKLNVDAVISRTRNYYTKNDEHEENPRISYELKIKSNENFRKNIGIRHCIQKLLRLEIATSYERYCDKVKNQHDIMINKVNYYHGIGFTLKKALVEARKIIYENEKSLNEYYSLLTDNLITNRRRQKRSDNIDVFKYKFMENAKKYCEKLGCEKWFEKNTYIINKTDLIIPHFTLQIMKIEKNNIIDVYDIGVAKEHSFLANGIVVHNCIPSRMTVSQLLECVLSKSCAIDGVLGDATPFSTNSVNIAEQLCERLEQNGFERHGWEQMYNGFTGEPMDAMIFIGPTYYQRLKHMVSDKLHSRSQGHVTTLTRQPLEGRSRDGGLRFGEMERDCIISHGASQFLKERLFLKSDPYTCSICSICGAIATTPTECKACGTDKVDKVSMPYASKLLLQELNAMGIKTVMKIKDVFK